jgi:hypothetical protein
MSPTAMCFPRQPLYRTAPSAVTLKIRSPLPCLHSWIHPHHLSSGVADPSGLLFPSTLNACALCHACFSLSSSFPSTFTCISMQCQSVSLPPPLQPLWSPLLLLNLIPMSFSVAGPHYLPFADVGFLSLSSLLYSSSSPSVAFPSLFLFMFPCFCYEWFRSTRHS